MQHECKISHPDDEEIVSLANWYTLGSAILLEALLEQKNKKIPPKQFRSNNFILENTFLENALRKYGIVTNFGGIYAVAIYNFKHSLELKSKRLLTHCDIRYKRTHNLLELADIIEGSIDITFLKNMKEVLRKHKYNCLEEEIKSCLNRETNEQLEALKSLIELLRVFGEYLKINDCDNDAFRFFDSRARRNKILDIFNSENEQIENLENAIKKSLESQWLFRIFRIYKLINSHQKRQKS